MPAFRRRYWKILSADTAIWPQFCRRSTVKPVAVDIVVIDSAAALNRAEIEGDGQLSLRACKRAYEPSFGGAIIAISAIRPAIFPKSIAAEKSA